VIAEEGVTSNLHAYKMKPSTYIWRLFYSLLCGLNLFMSNSFQG
jgi:hypothetical protein